MKPLKQLVGLKVKCNNNYSNGMIGIIIDNDDYYNGIGNESSYNNNVLHIEDYTSSSYPFRPEHEIAECKYYRLNSRGEEELSDTPFEDEVINSIEDIIYNEGDIVVITPEILISYPWLATNNQINPVGKVFKISGWENRMVTFNTNNSGIDERSRECDCIANSIFTTDVSVNIYKHHIRKATHDEINLFLSREVNGPRVLGRIELPDENIGHYTRRNSGNRMREPIINEPVIEEPIIHTPIITNIPNGYKGEVLNTILNTPQRINILKQSCSNRKYHDKIINSILPFKVGVEIECCDSLSLKLKKSNDEMKELLHCVDYSDDMSSGSNSFCEHRICFDGHKQIVSLYNLCNLLQKNCTINAKTGIHYHFDMPELEKFSFSDKQRLKKICETKFDKINSILNYKGSYNRKEVGIGEKGTWINIRCHSLNTIEIRIAGPSFDYTHIISEIIELSKIIQEMRTEMNFKEYRL